MAFRLPRLPLDVSITDGSGRAKVLFQRWWQSIVQKIEAQEAAQDTAIADLAAAQSDIITAQAAITAAQADILALQGDYSGLVAKDQTTAWATPTGTFDRTTFASVTSFTVSAAYKQAEVQALATHVAVLSKHLAALISDLRGNDVLT